MTEVKALAEARKRWGELAYVSVTWGYDKVRFKIYSNHWTESYWGDSWEACFEVADKEAGK